MRLFARAVGLALVILAVVVPSFAQGRGGGAFAQYAQKHQYTFQLIRMTRNIGELERNAKCSLKPDQAKRVLGVLKPLRSKPKLTDSQAQQALKSLKPIFTSTQTSAMAKMKQGFGGGQRMGDRRGGPRPGTPSGGVKPAGARPARPSGPRPNGPARLNPAAFENFNPFYSNPKAKDPRTAGMGRRWDPLFTALEKKAKQGAVKAKAKK